MKHLLLMVALFLIPGCAGQALSVKPVIADGGAAYVYLEPLPQEADRLSFTLGGIAAVTRDGTEIPLELRMDEFTVGTVTRQRLVATGGLPAGDYAGLSFRTARATLTGEDGKSALLVPEKPVRHDFPFRIERHQAVVLSLTFRFRDSVQGGFSFEPAFSVAIPDNPLPALTGYVANELSDTVMVFDKRAARVARVISTGRRPAGIAIDQQQRRAFVAVTGDDAVEMIDTNRNEIVSRTHLNPGDAPAELALTPDGRTLLVLNTASDSVSFVDPGSTVESARVTVGNAPSSLILDKNGRRAYVLNTRSNTISVIDVAGRSVMATIATDAGPFKGELNRKGDRLIVSHSTSPYLTMIDTATLSPRQKVYAGIGAAALKVNQVTDLLYVGFRTGGRIDIFDPFTQIPSDFIPASEGVTKMAIDGDENRLLVVRPRSGSIQFVNLVSRKEAAIIDVGEGAYGIALFGER